MKRRHITRTLGAALGGLLGVAYLPAASAFADVYEVVPDPSDTNIETVTGFYGLGNVSAPPAVPGTVQGEQLFDYVDKTTGQTVGTFYGYESLDQLNQNGNLDLANFLVTQDVTGTPGTKFGDLPNPGSVIEIQTQYGNETIYTDLTSSTGGKDVSYQTHVTAFGANTYNESFDPAAGLANNSLGGSNVPFADSNVTLTDGYHFVPTGGTNAENVTEISGRVPLDIDVQGNQEFNLVGPTGEVLGQFDAVQTNTSDFAGNYSEELLVTQDLSTNVGTAPGDIPPVDSIFNVFYHPGGQNYTLYSELPTSNGNEDISYSIFTNGKAHYGSTASSVDAAKALQMDKFDVPSENFTMTPTTPEIQEISGVNGLPPYDNAVQGYEQFNITDLHGNSIGVVDADVSDAVRSWGSSSEAVLVTGVESGTGGTAPGDVPPIGSVFDMVTNRGSDTYLLYSDIPSSNGDVITEYRVNANTGAAHEVHTKLDLAAGLNHDHFIDPFAGSDIDASAAGSVDPSDLASNIDPSGAISADPVTDSLLSSGSLLDAFPHIEAALQYLTGLL